MLGFPLSPSLSDCDSLDDIDDLDAFLEAQGQISHFPTPPLRFKDGIMVHEVEIDPSDDEEDGLDYQHIAQLFTKHASVGSRFNEVDIRMIERMLVRAQLPPEVLALAYNIVLGLDCHSRPVGSFYSAPNDLIVVSALSLAVSYTNDQPPTPKYWSRIVCDGAWTLIRIDKTVLQLCAALDWRLHGYSAPNAISQALDAFDRSIPHMPVVWLSSKPRKTHDRRDFTVTEKLKLIVDGGSTHWVNGQVTPDESPIKFGQDSEHRWLRLL